MQFTLQVITDWSPSGWYYFFVFSLIIHDKIVKQFVACYEICFLLIPVYSPSLRNCFEKTVFIVGCFLGMHSLFLTCVKLFYALVHRKVRSSEFVRFFLTFSIQQFIWFLKRSIGAPLFLGCANGWRTAVLSWSRRLFPDRLTFRHYFLQHCVSGTRRRGHIINRLV